MQLDRRRPPACRVRGGWRCESGGWEEEKRVECELGLHNWTCQGAVQDEETRMVYEPPHRHLGYVPFPFIVHNAHAKTGIIGLASTLYNNFLPFLLASRGAKFGDSSYYITYRNVRILSSFTHTHTHNTTTASHPIHPRHPRCLPRRLGSRTTVHRSSRHPSHILRQVSLLLLSIPSTLFNDPRAISKGLTGVFLFASTTARTSDALLGWNCGYAFHSNVRVSLSFDELVTILMWVRR